jgi:hypothetical protein
MTTTVPRIDPEAIYTDDLLYGELGLSRATLAEARRRGELRYVKKGKQILHFGRWVIRWLEGESGREPRPEGGAA